MPAESSDPTPRVPDGEIPEGMSPDARETWPHPALIDSWLGDAEIDFEFRPGEDVAVQDDPEARAAARKFRDVLGTFASGITVITTVSNGEPIGMTCQSFSSVSLDPPLVLFVPARSSRAWPVIQRTGRFCVNILAADQEHVSAQMATKGADKFADLDWHSGRGDRLAGHRRQHSPTSTAPSTPSTRAATTTSWSAGWSTSRRRTPRSSEPLLYYRGRYRTTDTEPASRYSAPPWAAPRGICA